MNSSPVSLHYRAIAKGVFKELTYTQKPKRIKFKLFLMRRYRKLCRLFKTTEQSHQTWQTSKALEWLADNDDMLESVINSLLHKFHVSDRILSTKQGMPYIFESMVRYLQRLSAPLDKIAINVFVSELDGMTQAGLNYDDLFCAKMQMQAAILCDIIDSIDACKKRPTSDIEDIVRTRILSLHELKYHDFETTFGYCRIEKLMNQDPSKSYTSCTPAYKAYLRKRVSVLSRRNGTQDTVLLSEYLSHAKSAQQDRKRCLAYYLTKRHRTSWYLPMITLMPILLTALLCKRSLWFAVVLFPLWESIKYLTDSVLSYVVTPTPLPALDLDTIQRDAQTLVVITTLVGKNDIHPLCEKLERMYLSNGKDNITFGLLCDLADSFTPNKADDKQICDELISHISALNQKYGEHFCMFMRKRTYSRSEKAFMGYERKRGAVLELIRLIHGEQTSFDAEVSIYPHPLPCFPYLITLDADTNLPIDAASTMIGIMRHPLNRPVYDKNNHVVEGYGILQPRISPELSAASKTDFSNIFCGVGGVDLYAGAAFDTYQDLYGYGIFCGKGILDTKAFYHRFCAENTFPNDTILSHDILEGELLRCALSQSLELTDGFPKNERSFFKRKHRWIRGDVQNLLFLMTKRTFALSPISHYKAFDNVRRSLVPLISTAGLIISSFLPSAIAYPLMTISLSWLLLPIFVGICRLFVRLRFRIVTRKFYTKGIVVGIEQSLKQFGLQLCLLFKDASNTFDAVLRSVYRRLISKEKLLEWTTAKDAEHINANSFWSYVRYHFADTAVGLFLFLFSPYGCLKMVGFLWLVSPVVGYVTAMPCYSFAIRRAPSEREKEDIRRYAHDCFGYFNDMVTEKDNYLPPDNLQLFPRKIVAHRTSPTNIGLYLTALLTARDFNLVSSEILCSKLKKTLSVICKLPSYHGNLYNWYNTETLEVLEPRYVSSVDSGNFIACCYTVMEGLKDYVGECPALLGCIADLENTITKTNIGIFYNKQRALLSLGIGFENEQPVMSDNCYDLYMSEARTTRPCRRHT